MSKKDKMELTELGGCKINDKLDVIVSKDTNDNLYIGQRQTFYETNGTPVHVFRHKATLCMDKDTFKILVQGLQDIYNSLELLHK